MGLSIADFFAQADALPMRDLDAIVGAGGVLVVAPHADDESLGCGGLLALCASMKRRVRVVIVSDGVGSHPTSKQWPAPKLRDLRESEARAAIGALGLDEACVDFLALPDRFVPCAGPAAETAAQALAQAARAIAASAMLVTWRHDPHCDHAAAFALAARARALLAGEVRLLEYPIWGHTRTDDAPAAPRGARLDIAPVLAQKRRAIAAHRSQMTGLIDDDPFGFALKPAMIARFERPFEIFLEAV